MLTDDLAETFSRRAADIATQPRDLLLAVEHRAARRQRRRVAGLTAVVLVALSAAGVTAGIVHGRSAHTPATLGVARQPSAAVADLAGLTGSMCDPVGPRPPVNFLSWPCVRASPGKASTLLAGLTDQLLRGYGSIAHPRVHLLASNENRAVLEWWDADHPETPAQLIIASGGIDYQPTPAGDPAIVDTEGYVGDTTVLARSPITSILAEPSGQRFNLDGGAHGVYGESAPTRVVGYDNGVTRPAWNVSADRQTSATSDAYCGGLAGVGTCQYVPFRLSDLAPAALCDAAPASLPAGWLSWPCVPAADGTAGQRVAAAKAAVRGQGHGTRDLRARLIADTRNDRATASDFGMSLSAVEVWDAASTGPAVVVIVSDRGPGTVGVNFDLGFGSPGDPVMLNSDLGSDVPGRAQDLLVVRSDVISVSLTGKGVHAAAPVHGGTVALSRPSGNPNVSPDYTYTARTADGRVAGSATSTSLPATSGGRGFCQVGDTGSTCGDTVIPFPGPDGPLGSASPAVTPPVS